MADHDQQRFIADRLGQADVDDQPSASSSPTARRSAFVPAPTAPILVHARGVAPTAGPDPGEATPPRARPTAPADRLHAVRGRGHALEPVHVPGDRAGQRHRRCSPRSRSSRSASACWSSAGPGPPVHDPAPPPDRGRRAAWPRATSTRRVPAERGPRRLVRDRRAGRPVQRDGRPARGERRDHPPRPRPEPRLPGRRLARAADAARGPADVQRAAHARAPATTRTRAPSSSSRAASRSSGSTGWPRTCSSSRSSTRASSCSTCGRTTCAPRSNRPSSRRAAAARRRGVDADPPPARRARSGSATTRSGSARSWRTSSATPSSSRRAAARSTVDVSADAPTGRGSRCADTGRRASTRPSCRTSSSASTAARGRTRRAAAAAGSGLAIVQLDRRHARRHGRGREPRRRRVDASWSTLPRDPRLVERHAGGRARPRSRRRTPATRSPERTAARTCRKLHRPTARR